MSLVERFHAGKLGEPISATAARLAQPPAWADWALNLAGRGGAVFDLCVHDFDALNWLLGARLAVAVANAARRLLESGRVASCGPAMQRGGRGMG